VRWATRAVVYIDRAACAWLLRRFIDPDAEFLFVTDPDEIPADATPFDIRGAELSHHGGDCSFETILRRYKLQDPVLWDLARIVQRPTWPTTATTPRGPRPGRAAAWPVHGRHRPGGHRPGRAAV
jgi:hypothetical protein